MFRIVLYQPEIPPNTGNIIRLCANVGAELHLIEPLGFELSDKRMRRAGLDYHEFAAVEVHSDLASCRSALGPGRWFAFTKHATARYTNVHYQAGDVLLFGPETRGLDQSALDQAQPDDRLLIPMRPGNRSLNLSNAVAVAAYEAWRQLEFAGTVR